MLTSRLHPSCAQVFELVKNSLRAVNDRYQDSDDLPPNIRVVVAEGGEDVTIKVTNPRGICATPSVSAHQRCISMSCKMIISWLLPALLPESADCACGQPDFWP